MSSLKEHNWNLLTLITKQSVLKNIKNQTEVVLVIANKYFFDQEWPFTPEHGFSLDMCGNLIFSQEIPVGPIFLQV